jgi:type IV pilus secretin PilQ/predicted competence protein
MAKFVIKCLLALILFFASSAHAWDLNDKLNQKVSTTFSGTSLENALRLLAQQYSLNLIMSGEISGRVNVRLVDVKLADALNALLKVNGYHYIISEDVVLVKAFDSAMNGELETKVYPVYYLDGYKLRETIQPLLSAKGRIEALLSENEKDDKQRRSNTLLVTDVWENQQEIARVIEALDKPSPQLQIEVRLIESLVGDQQRIGIDYPTSVGVSMTGAETTAPVNQSQQQTGGQPNLLAAWYELPAVNDNLSLGVLTFDQLKATLDFLAQDKNATLVSNPKVTTLNNKKAIIRIGTTVPIPEISRGVSGDLYSYKEKQVDMYVEVIPQIGQDSLITLTIHPILEEIVGYTGSADAPQPITSRREVQSTVMVRNGETVAIGGLVKETENEIENKVWLLGDIPVLGYLFRHTSIIKEKQNLLIFITPNIMQ